MEGSSRRSRGFREREAIFFSCSVIVWGVLNIGLAPFAHRRMFNGGLGILLLWNCVSRLIDVVQIYERRLYINKKIGKIIQCHIIVL